MTECIQGILMVWKGRGVRKCPAVPCIRCESKMREDLQDGEGLQDRLEEVICLLVGDTEGLDELLLFFFWKEFWLWWLRPEKEGPGIPVREFIHVRC